MVESLSPHASVQKTEATLHNQNVAGNSPFVDLAVPCRPAQEPNAKDKSANESLAAYSYPEVLIAQLVRHTPSAFPR